MRSGIDTSAIDPAIRPQDDLFGHVNGTWLATAEIPGDRSRYGTFDQLREASEAAVRTLVEEAAQGTQGQTSGDTPQWRVGALYRSFMDADRAQALGVTPLVPGLSRIAGVSSPSEVARVSGAQQREGAGGLIGWYVASDAKNPGIDVTYLSQSGLGLPDEEYYRAEQHQEVREAYVAYLGTIFGLAAPALAEAGLDLGAEAPQRVLALETTIAKHHRDKVSARDVVKAYTKLTRAELEKQTPGIDWSAWSEALAGGNAVLASTMLSEVVSRQPEQLTALGEALTTVPVEDWQAWLAVRLINSLAPFLNSELVEAHFDLYERTLSGTPQMKDRWKRGVALVEGLIGEDTGQMYVAAHFPERARARMDALVANVVEAFRQRISTLEWMGDETRQQALAKLAAFRPKIGCPPRWRDYSAFEVSAEDLHGNLTRGSAVETDYELNKVGGPVDRDAWLMTPQTVNAYYHPLLNEIVFPAAILQPPFFDVDADDAVNYGGIGAVIAHEIGHGFDDQGSRCDGDGLLRDWWTQEDREAFEALAARLITQFDVLSPRELPGETVKGALTIGENIGDLCGLEMALSAYLLTGGGEDLDGLTAVQRFFYSWARIWQTMTRPEQARRMLTVDPHSPPDLRANLVRNVAAFHEAFATTPEDSLWLAESDRVRIF